VGGRSDKGIGYEVMEREARSKSKFLIFVEK
jgi:hypothetical protein